MCPWDSISIAQALCICLIWVFEVVWSGYQPQPYRCGIIITPQVNLNAQIGGQLAQSKRLLIRHSIPTTFYYKTEHFRWFFYLKILQCSPYQRKLNKHSNLQLIDSRIFLLRLRQMSFAVCRISWLICQTNIREILTIRRIVWLN